MRKMWQGAGAALFAVSLWAAGCGRILPTIEVPLELADAGIGEFDVAAGVPEQAKADFGGGDAPVDAGRGTIRIPLSAIDVTPADGGGGKVRQAQQAIDDCNTACAAAGVDAATCADVCDEAVLKITVSIGTAAQIEADCQGGEDYLFDVELDDAGQPTSVAVDPSSLSDSTIDLLNGDGFSVCVEVISPIDGRVIIDRVVLDVGL